MPCPRPAVPPFRSKAGQPAPEIVETIPRRSSPDPLLLTDPPGSKRSALALGLLPPTPVRFRARCYRTRLSSDPVTGSAEGWAVTTSSVAIGGDDCRASLAVGLEVPEALTDPGLTGAANMVEFLGNLTSAEWDAILAGWSGGGGGGGIAEHYHLIPGTSRFGGGVAFAAYAPADLAHAQSLGYAPA